jgi:hypothetical protein
LIFALSKALHRLIMSVFLKNSLLCLSVTAALSLTACGGSGGSSASDAPTSTIAPSYELVGNVLSVTNSGIIDADGVTDLLYVLTNSAGQEVARQNSPRFADLAAGSYTLSTEGRAKNGVTGASVAVVNAKSASVVVLTPKDTTPPTITITGSKVITLTQGDTFVMPRVTASDTTDGVVEVKIEGSIDTTKVGTQTLKLTATDKAGNIGSDTISVTIAAADPAPTAPAGSAFAGLGDMTVGDFGGNPAIGGGPSIVINAGGVVDPLGRAIRYSATGLPAGLSIDRDTGVISGVYDAGGFLQESEKYNITIIATPATSTKSLSKPFVLSIRNDG